MAGGVESYRTALPTATRSNIVSHISEETAYRSITAMTMVA